ncbi:hypothetical protein BCG9842_0133 (plasmid) [Bacillus cereus G9842]|uniref:Uncharacterized protein n=1 Tax=Bacillus cereus (strain G9842) TaxID=405531 RepID=B7IYS4_BACC2|nr:hypothetical protein BCG9842_0133 [Bacillus cereus G9842]
MKMDIFYKGIAAVKYIKELFILLYLPILLFLSIYIANYND